MATVASSTWHLPKEVMVACVWHSNMVCCKRGQRNCDAQGLQISGDFFLDFGPWWVMH